MGVRVTGQLVTYPLGQYPTHATALGLGGWREVADATARNAIPNYLREQGMAVYTISDAKVWILNASPWNGTNADWTQFTGGGGSTFSWLLALGMPAMVATDVGLWKIAQSSGTLSRIDLTSKAGFGPVGADLIIDILKSSDGGSTFTSLWATHPANRPKIANGAIVGNQTSFDTVAYLTGHVFRLDIVQVGSITAGMNIDVQLTGG